MNRRDFLLALAALLLMRPAMARPANGLYVFGTPPAPQRMRQVFSASAVNSPKQR